MSTNRPGGWNSHMKRSGMLVISLKDSGLTSGADNETQSIFKDTPKKRSNFRF